MVAAPRGTPSVAEIHLNSLPLARKLLLVDTLTFQFSDKLVFCPVKHNNQNATLTSSALP